jgi:hypothetical protein
MVIACEALNLEPANPLSMPSRGTVKPVPLYALDNPPQGIDGSTNEISVREDVADLWGLYCGLDAERRGQFLQAASKWQEALIHWQDRPSLSAAIRKYGDVFLDTSHATRRSDFAPSLASRS